MRCYACLDVFSDRKEESFYILFFVLFFQRMQCQHWIFCQKIVKIHDFFSSISCHHPFHVNEDAWSLYAKIFQLCIFFISTPTDIMMTSSFQLCSWTWFFRTTPLIKNFFAFFRRILADVLIFNGVISSALRSNIRSCSLYSICFSCLFSMYFLLFYKCKMIYHDLRIILIIKSFLLCVLTKASSDWQIVFWTLFPICKKPYPHLTGICTSNSAFFMYPKIQIENTFRICLCRSKARR